MAYVSEKASTARMVGLGLVILLHIGLIYALKMGLAQSALTLINGPIQAAVIQDQQTQKKLEPPPPPPAEKIPPPFVPPPEININIQTTDSNAISAVTRSNDTPPHSDPRHKNSEPEYPPAARRMNESGTVRLLLRVEVDGSVSQAKVETSSGFELLDQSAIREALRSWRFIPGTKNGQPVPSWYSINVKFRIPLGL